MVYYTVLGILAEKITKMKKKHEFSLIGEY
jgi:hypothetical protein